jgi:hypothetical protein
VGVKSLFVTAVSAALPEFSQATRDHFLGTQNLSRYTIIEHNKVSLHIALYQGFLTFMTSRYIPKGEV